MVSRALCASFTACFNGPVWEAPDHIQIVQRYDIFTSVADQLFHGTLPRLLEERRFRLQCAVPDRHWVCELSRRLG